MGTRSPKTASTPSKTKQHQERKLKAGAPAVQVVPASKQHRRNKRKPYSFAPRDDFVKHVRYLDEADAADLDKLRDDLQESIERVARVQHAFVKALNKQASKSNRIKSIAQAVGEIPFHCDLQRKIVSQGVTTILESKAALAKQRKEEAAAKKHEDHAKNCISCFACEHW